jgi:hypothetical protein
MDGRGSEGAYLDELKAFVRFLGGLWGLLAGLSVFFPLSNVLVRVIPLEAYGAGGVFDRISPDIITTAATVVALFVILATFSGRRAFQRPDRRRVGRRDAWLSLGVGILFLLAYIALHQTYAESAWEPWGWGSGDPRKLLVEVPLLLTYTTFFSALTRAFMLLGMIEYFGTRGAESRGERRAA